MRSQSFIMRANVVHEQQFYGGGVILNFDYKYTKNVFYISISIILASSVPVYCSQIKYSYSIKVYYHNIYEEEIDQNH